MSPRRSLARIYALEARYELLKLVRMPAYLAPMLVFPMMFYLLFGVAFRRPGAGSFDMATYLLATYGAFGVMNAALFGFGVGVAMERGQGWMLFKRATPMPPLAWLAGRLTACVLCGALMVTCLFTLGGATGGVRMPLIQWLSLAGVLVAGRCRSRPSALPSDRGPVPIRRRRSSISSPCPWGSPRGPDLAAAAWDEADPLTDRERQVLHPAAEGLSTARIGAEIHLSEGTVRNYLSEAISKLGAENRVEAARIARQKERL
jgi:DNA-binding CsgD family transcriptional regulator